MDGAIRGLIHKPAQEVVDPQRPARHGARSATLEKFARPLQGRCVPADECRRSTPGGRADFSHLYGGDGVILGRAR